MSAIAAALKGITKHLNALENAVKTDTKSLNHNIEKRIVLDTSIEVQKVEIGRANTVIGNLKTLLATPTAEEVPVAKSE